MKSENRGDARHLIDEIREKIETLLESAASNGSFALCKEIGGDFERLSQLLDKRDHDLKRKNSEIEHLDRELTRALEHIKIKNKEIHDITVTDSTTGLFKQDSLVPVFEEEVARCRRYGYPLAVIKVHVDGFRNLVDRYGLIVGDRVLGYAGAVIKKNIRKFDRAFRHNEDIIVVLPETDLTLAYMAAERLRNNFKMGAVKVSKYDGVSEEDVLCTMSIGITATYPYVKDSIGFDEILEQMNKALFKALKSGGNASVLYE